MVDGKRMLTPCSPGDPERIEMSYDQVNSDELLAPDVVLKDFEAALEDSNKSVGKEDLQKQVEWTQEYGTDGS